MFPFFPSLSGQVAAVGREVDSLGRRAGRMVADDADRPWLKITGYYASAGLYAYTEQMLTAAGAFMDKPGGRVGKVAGLAGETRTVLPAKEMNGRVATSFPFYVKAERGQSHASYGLVYEFAYTPVPSGGVGTPAAVVGGGSVTTAPFASAGLYQIDVLFQAINFPPASPGFAIQRWIVALFSVVPTTGGTTWTPNVWFGAPFTIVTTSDVNSTSHTFAATLYVEVLTGPPSGIGSVFNAFFTPQGGYASPVSFQTSVTTLQLR